MDLSTPETPKPFALISFQTGSAHGGRTTIPVEILDRPEKRGRVYVRHPDGKGPQWYNRSEISIGHRAETLEELLAPFQT